MNTRIKSMVGGLGFAFGLQVIISLIFTGIAFSAARSETGIQQNMITLLIFGLTLGAFLIGGFVIGRMGDTFYVLDAIIVALLTLILSTLIFLMLPDMNRDQFVTGLWLSGGSRSLTFTFRSLLFVGCSVVASVIGAYIGSRVSAPRESMLDRTALILGLIGAVIGPFILLAISGGDPTNPNQPNLPWYFLLIVFILLLVIVGAGFIMFTRVSHYEEDISINPDVRKEV